MFVESVELILAEPAALFVRDCATLKNARHRIKKISEEEAIREGKKPCKRCYRDVLSFVVDDSSMVSPVQSLV